MIVKRLLIVAVILSLGEIFPRLDAEDITVPPLGNRVLCMVCQRQSDGVYLAFCDATATVEAVAWSGLHYHAGSPRYGNPRVGTLSPSAGMTGMNGYLATWYSASRIRQTERITVYPENGLGDAGWSEVTVKHDGLVELWSGWAHETIGETSSHPWNHFFKPETRDAVLAVVEQYAIEFGNYSGGPEPWEPVGVNDSSLPGGGVFDICATVWCEPSSQNPSGGYNPWGGPHASSAHDNGDAVDFRANTGPNNIINHPDVKWRFRQICIARGLPTVYHESVGTTNEHIHCARY